MSWSGHSLAYLHAPAMHTCMWEGCSSCWGTTTMVGEEGGGSPLVGDPSAQRPDCSHERTDTADTPRSRHSMATQRREAGAGNYEHCSRYRPMQTRLHCCSHHGTNRPTDIRTAFYIMTTAHDYFLSVRSLLVYFTRYGLLFFWVVHLLRSTTFHLDWTCFGGRLGSKRIWIWIRIYGLGYRYGFGWRLRSRIRLDDKASGFVF
jgi:hypothetical protein